MFAHAGVILVFALMQFSPTVERWLAVRRLARRDDAVGLGETGSLACFRRRRLPPTLALTSAAASTAMGAAAIELADRGAWVLRTHPLDRVGWAIAFGLFILAMAVVFRRWLPQDSARASDEPRCAACGYPIAGAERCAECGARFERVGVLPAGGPLRVLRVGWFVHAVTVLAAASAASSLALLMAPTPVVVSHNRGFLVEDASRQAAGVEALTERIAFRIPATHRRWSGNNRREWEWPGDFTGFLSFHVRWVAKWDPNSQVVGEAHRVPVRVQGQDVTVRFPQGELRNPDAAVLADAMASELSLDANDTRRDLLRHATDQLLNDLRDPNRPPTTNTTSPHDPTRPLGLVRDTRIHPSAPLVSLAAAAIAAFLTHRWLTTLRTTG